MIEAGGDVSEVWDLAPPHDMSMVAEDGQLYPSANLFTLMIRYFYGEEVRAAPTSPSIRAYAVRSSFGHSLLLSNLSNTPLLVVLRFGGWKAGQRHEFQISSAGYRDMGRVKTSGLAIHRISLPGYSVTAPVE